MLMRSAEIRHDWLMADLTLHGRRVETVFDLLGEKEDDITYSVGWGLAASDELAGALLREAFGEAGDAGELTAVRLQEIDPETGRTDIEVETEFASSWSRPSAAGTCLGRRSCASTRGA